MSFFARRGFRGVLPLRQAHLRALLDGAPLASAIVDDEGRALAVNRAMMKLLGWRQVEMTDLGLLQRVYGPDATDLRDRFTGLMSGGTDVLRSKQRWVLRSGEVIWCRLMGHRVTVGDETRPLAVLTLEDISEQVRLEEERWDTET